MEPSRSELLSAVSLRSVAIRGITINFIKFSSLTVLHDEIGKIYKVWMHDCVLKSVVYLGKAVEALHGMVAT